MATVSNSNPATEPQVPKDPATPAPRAGQSGRAVSRPTSPPGGVVSAAAATADHSAAAAGRVSPPSGRPSLSVALPLLDITNATSSTATRPLDTCAPPPGLVMQLAAGSTLSSSVSKQHGPAPARTARRSSTTGTGTNSGPGSASASSSAGSSPRSASADTVSAPPPTPTPGVDIVQDASAAQTSTGDVSPRTRAREGLAELGIEVDWQESDQFYMYVYKVMLCPKKYSHEWSACPFAHKGERATRRDPRHIVYSATSCPDFKAGPCPRGDHCPYSHGVFEACLHPERYRTQLCNSGHNCRRSVCFFAHSLPELRTPTCQPVAQPLQQPTPAVAPAAASVQPDLLAQILALRAGPSAVPQQPAPQLPTVQELAAQMLLGKCAEAPARPPSQEDLLRAQLAQYQQTLGLMSSLLSSASGTQPSAAAASPSLAELLAQLQLGQQQQPQQHHQLLPVMTEHSMYPSVLPQASKSSKYDAERMVSDFEAGLKLTNLSPRTPFDTTLTSPASNGGVSSPPNPLLAQPYTPAATPAPTSGHGYSLFPEDASPEERLPANLMESL